MKRWSLIGALVAGFLMLAALPRGGTVAAGPAPQQNDADFAVEHFVRVIDGDSVEFWRGGTRWGVGLVGVVTPMGNTPCGQSATGRMWQLTGAGVRLVAEPGTNLDARGRRMYHAYAADGTSIAQTLVSEGWVRASREKSSVRTGLVQAEAEARRDNRGCLWGNDKGPRGFERKEPRKQPRIVAEESSQITGPAAIAERDPVGIGDGPIANAVSVAGYQDLLVAGGFISPTTFKFLPDGRILVAEQRGVVKVRANGVTSTVIDISSQVNDYWDRGLIGLAVDPDFATNGWIYLGYTYENNPATYSGTKTARLIRVTMLGNSASIGTAVTILGSQVGDSCDSLPAGADCIPSESPSHTIGTPEFGPDGKLYLTTGDGAHFNYVDPRALRAQDLNTFSGKVVRVNSDGTAPSDNPNYTGNPNDVRSKVYASGLRNPFRNNFNPATGRLYLGDVGWGSREEISVARPGSNFGWPCYEGSPQQSGYSSYAVCQSLYNAGVSAHTRPLIEWGHVGGSSAAVGGAFAASYSGAQQNAYFYGDYGQGFVRYVRVDANDALTTTPQEFATNLEAPVSIQRGPDGQIYYLAIGTGEIRYFNSSTANQQPIAVMAATPTNGLAPLAVEFSAAGTNDPDNDPLTFTWDFGDGTNASGLTASKTYGTDGVYTATLTVTDGKGGIGTASTVITVGNRAPTVSIESPSASLQYKVGDTIQLQASGTDPDDGGTLPSSALSWTIVLHHGTHTHPFLTLDGATQSFVIPDHGDNTWFEIIANGADSGGLTASATVEIHPQSVQLTLNSDPTGLLLSYDGVLVRTPHVATTVVGSTHTLNATPSGGFVFDSWSDGGTQQHNITIGADPLSFTAYYRSHITFEDLSANTALNGEYPVDAIEWGTGKWFLSGPWAGNTGNSVSFTGPGVTSQTFTFVTPRILTSVSAWNGGSASTVTLACDGNITKTQSVAGGGNAVISTGWTVPCSTVTVTSSNGWNTNFDDLILAGSAPDDTTPPVFSAVTGTPTSATTATVTWTTNEPSTSQVEYGTTVSYGSFAPLVPNPALVTAHSVQLTGLAPDQAYQFRVRSTDLAGNAGISANATFSTPALDGEPPIITNVAHSGLTETTATVTWTTDEPSNTQVLYGLTASYGSFAPAAPNPSLVLSHSQLISGLLPSTTYFYSVRSADAAGNVSTLAGGSFTTASPAPVTTANFNDFANPDRPLGGQYPAGVINWGTNKWYLSSPWGLFTTNSVSFLSPGMASQTFDFVTPRRLITIDAYNGGGAASTVTIACAGNTTRSLSISAGTLQTISTNFTAPCTTVTIGTTNGWSTNFDNLTFDSGIADSTPPSLSAVTTTNVTHNAATITWTTNEAANAQADYGLTTGYGTLVPLTPGAATNTSHSVSLTSLTPATTYFYRVLSRDVAGNLGTASGFQFTTAVAPDTTPPVISAVTASSITTTGATITWTTNEAANAQADYGLTTGYGTLVPLTPGAATNTSHSVSLTSLTPATTYFYRVLSRDAAGNLGTASGFQFTTAAAPDTTPPVISAVTASSITTTGATITWTTNEAANAQADYGLTTGYGTLVPLTPGAATNTSHSVSLSGLTPATTYFYRVLSRDAAGNLGTASGFQFTTAAAPDTTPPVISAVTASSITTTGATITWTTNEAANAQADYGLTMGYGTLVPLTPGAATNTSHSVSLTGLTPATTYFYRVLSRDATGNLGTASGFQFTTAAAPDTTPPVISAVTASSITTTGATITWTTNEAANAQVDFGLTTGYGTLAPLTPGAATNTSHSVALTGLSPATTYFYRVLSRDAAGNLGTASGFQFTTAAAPDTTPPVISAVTALGITTSGATITWTTNEAANAQVDFGLTTGYGTLVPLTPGAATNTSHSVALTGLSPATTYFYRVLSRDAAGNLGTASGFQFTTAALLPVTTVNFNDLTSPDRTLSGQYPSGVIDWGTNKWYLSSPWGLFTTNSISFLAPGVASQTFNFVTPLRLITMDAYNGGGAASTVTIACAGNTTRSVSVAAGTLQTISTNFTTPCTTVTLTTTNGWSTNFDNLTFDSGIVDSTPPALSAVTTTNVTTTSATITWTTNEAANAQADYGLTAAYGTLAPLTPGAATNTSHSVSLSGLTPATTYFYRVLSRDASGNLGTASGFQFTTNADTTPPSIFAVTASSIGQSNATITWTTNEAANAQLDFGLTTGYGTLVPLTPGAATNTSHSISLTGLSPATTYFYRVLSRDAAGNLGTATGFQFTTTAPDTTPPVISAVTASGMTTNGATITWATNEAANAQVDFGLTTGYGTLVPLTPGAATNTSHSVSLTGLSPATTYFYRVLSRDASGNQGTATGFQFTTAAAPPPNNALRFDGSDDIATAPDSNSLDIAGPITIEAWIKLESAPAGRYQTIAFKRGSASGSNIAYALYYRGGLLFEFRNGSTTYDLNDGRTISQGVWHHVAAVYDRATIRLFVDGQLTASRAATPAITATAGAFSVGANFAWSNEQFTGTIDELRLSSVARYTANFTPPAAFSADAGTQGLWHFDEGTGQTIADASGNGNTLTRGTNGTTETRDPAWVPGSNFVVGSTFMAPAPSTSPVLMAAIVPSSSDRRRLARAGTAA